MTFANLLLTLLAYLIFYAYKELRLQLSAQQEELSSIFKKYEEKEIEIINLIEDGAKSSRRNIANFKALANEMNSSGLLAQEIQKSSLLTATNRTLLHDLDSERAESKKLLAKIHQLEKSNSLQLEMTRKQVVQPTIGKKYKR